jgi:hypothetical protein
MQQGILERCQPAVGQNQFMVGQEIAELAAHADILTELGWGLLPDQTMRIDSSPNTATPPATSLSRLPMATTGDCRSMVVHIRGAQVLADRASFQVHECPYQKIGLDFKRLSGEECGKPSQRGGPATIRRRKQDAPVFRFAQSAAAVTHRRP